MSVELQFEYLITISLCLSDYRTFLGIMYILNMQVVIFAGIYLKCNLTYTTYKLVGPRYWGVKYSMWEKWHADILLHIVLINLLKCIGLNLYYVNLWHLRFCSPIIYRYNYFSKWLIRLFYWHNNECRLLTHSTRLLSLLYTMLCSHLLLSWQAWLCSR